jgi:hypothetical protein
MKRITPKVDVFKACFDNHVFKGALSVEKGIRDNHREVMGVRKKRGIQESLLIHINQQELFLHLCQYSRKAKTKPNFAHAPFIVANAYFFHRTPHYDFVLRRIGMLMRIYFSAELQPIESLRLFS